MRTDGIGNVFPGRNDCENNHTASINPPFAIPTHYGKTEIAGEYVEELYRLNDKIKTEILF